MVLENVDDFLEKNWFLHTIQYQHAVSNEALTLAASMDYTCILIRKHGWKNGTATTVIHTMPKESDLIRRISVVWLKKEKARENVFFTKKYKP